MNLRLVRLIGLLCALTLGGCLHVAQCFGLRPTRADVAATPVDRKLDTSLRRIIAAYGDPDLLGARKRLAEQHELASDDRVSVIIRTRPDVSAGIASARLEWMHCEIVFAAPGSVFARIPGGLVEAVANIDWIISMARDKPGQFGPSRG